MMMHQSVISTFEVIWLVVKPCQMNLITMYIATCPSAVYFVDS